MKKLICILAILATSNAAFGSECLEKAEGMAAMLALANDMEEGEVVSRNVSVPGEVTVGIQSGESSMTIKATYEDYSPGCLIKKVELVDFAG